MGGVENKASGIQRLGRNQEAYDKFAQAVEVPLMVVTIAWLPVLIVPLVHPVHGSVAETFAVIDYMIWALSPWSTASSSSWPQADGSLSAPTSSTCSSSPSPSSAP